MSSDTASWCNLKEKYEYPLLASFNKQEPDIHNHGRYRNSTLLSQLLITELAKRISVTIINYVNSGIRHSSGLTRDADGTFLGFIMAVIVPLVGRTPSVSARSGIDTAVNHGEELHGQCLENCELIPCVIYYN